jgi:hypothetical protein
MRDARSEFDANEWLASSPRTAHKGRTTQRQGQTSLIGNRALLALVCLVAGMYGLCYGLHALAQWLT